MDSHYRRIELQIAIDQFHQLPRNSAYKYEYWDGRAVLSPRPKSQRAVLDMQLLPKEGPWEVRPLPVEEIEGLVGCFLSAFRNSQPFASLTPDEAQAAARDCLVRTRAGEDGPLIPSACFQVFTKHHERPIGAALVTLSSDEVLENPFGGEWKDQPADALHRRLGCPHLTWVFVDAWDARRGVGTRLLAEVVEALLTLGYKRLASTFLQGNDSSVFWHWRSGFRLVPWSNYVRIVEGRRAGPDRS
jgi:hypothetical protein